MAEKTGMNSQEPQRNIKLTFAYDGSNYHGFQYQKNALSVQQAVEEKLALILGEPVRISGAARTDKGVHAYQQVVTFRSCSRIPVERIPVALNGILPKDIVILTAQVMPGDFHARFSATGKRYCYRILNSPHPDPFERNHAWRIEEPLNVRRMNRAIKTLVGEHNFAAFQATGSAARSPVRTLYKTSCRRQKQWVELEFVGNGFLYHMVRNIVGTLVEVGLRKRSHDSFVETLLRCDRKLAGPTAPASGLYLMEVFYDKLPKTT